MPPAIKKLVLVLLPSWVSGLAVVVVALIIVAFNYFRSRSDIGALQEGIQGLKFALGPLYHRLTDNLAQNSIANNLPLLLLWAAVGAAVYVLAIRIFASFSTIATLEQTMFYLNLKRDSFVRSIIISFGLRLMALFAWFIYCSVFFKTILPNVASEARNGSLVVPAVGLIVALHIHVIFARLIMLRLRVFSSSFAQ